jgi:hypothetical protein
MSKELKLSDKNERCLPVRLYSENEADISTIKEATAIRHDNDAIRAALRFYARRLRMANNETAVQS